MKENSEVSPPGCGGASQVDRGTAAICASVGMRNGGTDGISRRASCMAAFAGRPLQTRSKIARREVHASSTAPNWRIILLKCVEAFRAFSLGSMLSMLMLFKRLMSDSTRISRDKGGAIAIASTGVSDLVGSIPPWEVTSSPIGLGFQASSPLPLARASARSASAASSGTNPRSSTVMLWTISSSDWGGGLIAGCASPPPGILFGCCALAPSRSLIDVDLEIVSARCSAFCHGSSASSLSLAISLPRLI
mmetsp:Transcript_29561/g.94850  ORF Transcript_29561/g.94850 Transcript_29561/m.94850 type:complete len:249 (-) Transcript_29561:3472-4218(-)